MTTRTGYFVRALDDYFVFEKGDIMQVVSVSASPLGAVLLGFGEDGAVWDASAFEEIEIHDSYQEGVVKYEAPEPTIEITRKEYLALLDAEMWWHSALLGNVRDYCGWSDVVAHYLQLRKEEKEAE